MAEQIRVPLSPFQAARFASIKAEQEGMLQRSNELTVRHTEGLTIAIGSACDFAAIPDWSKWNVEVIGAEIVCTPPPAPLELVKEA
jgi:hypothetical protein